MATAAKKTSPQAAKEEPKKAVAKKSPVQPVAAAAKSAAAKAPPAAKPAAAKPAAAKPAAAKPAPVKPVAGKAASKPEPVKGAAVAKKAATAKSESAKAPAKKSAGQVLTDADILKMPEKDYMNEVQLNFFKAKLQAMKEDILDNARETGEHLKENEVFADPNDRATVEEENMLEQRVRDRERKLLKKIEQALGRIDSGDYGYCLETGEPIGIPRLLARPTAELSIEAQEKHERMERLYAD